jgi:diguanylate cyclase (GGDEF)-like protein
MPITRSKLIPPLLVLLLTLGAITAVWVLIQRVDSSRGEQLRIAAMTVSVADLQSAPFNADRNAGGRPSAVLREILTDERSISEGLTAQAQEGTSPGLLATGRSRLGTIEPLVESIFVLATQKGGLTASGQRVAELQQLLTARTASLSLVLLKIEREDAGSAETARTQAKLGAAAAMGLLLLAFSLFYFRSLSARDAVERLVREKEALLGVSRTEAMTDALTGLANRRALTGDLARATRDSTSEQEVLLAIFDLDGFKQYNDTFGHAAGDELLQRLGERLGAVTTHSGNAYRMGGDEFCILVPCPGDGAEQLLDDSVRALSGSGEGWRVGCSHGAVWIPSEADTESHALKLADERMYANKAHRSPSGRRADDMLLR